MSAEVGGPDRSGGAVNPRRVIVSYFGIAGLYTLAAALIWGVNTLFLLDAGLDIFGVFIANSAFTAGMVVFEIPTGVLADTRGRRASFLISVLILTITTVGYLVTARAGGGLVAFSAVSVVMGLGFTFYSGAVEAWLVDALRATSFTGQLDRVFARGSMVTGGAMLVGTLGGGALGTVDLALPYVVRAIMLVAVFGVAWFSMYDLGFTPRAIRLAQLPAEMRVVARASLEYGWRHRSVRLLMFIAFVQYGFLSWGYHAWQPYFLELLESNAVWVAGVIAALVATAMIVGNVLVDWASRFCARRTTLLIVAASVQALAAIGVGVANGFWVAVGLYLVVAVGMGVAGPVKQAYLHDSIPSAQRASVASFNSMFGNGGGVVGQSGLGYLSRVRSIGDGYVVGGVVTLAALPLLLALRRLGGTADRIVPEHAGVKSACAAQGLPDVSLVDAGQGI